MDLCEIFRTTAYKTWDVLARARNIEHQIGEESFTDFILLDIKERNSKQVITKTFTKPQEAFSGADWEWWFKGINGKWLGFLVQAKVINLESDSYEHLHYLPPSKLKNGIYQVDRLIERALTSNEPIIPIYCLYTHWHHLKYPTFYKTTRTKGPCEAFGCSIVNAFSIRQLNQQGKKKHLNDLLEHMAPWNVLVCSTTPEEDLAERAYQVWRKTLEDTTTYEGDELERMAQLQPLERPPEYIQQLLAGELIEAPDINLNRITVFQQAED